LLYGEGVGGVDCDYETAGLAGGGAGTGGGERGGDFGEDADFAEGGDREDHGFEGFRLCVYFHFVGVGELDWGEG